MGPVRYSWGYFEDNCLYHTYPFTPNMIGTFWDVLARSKKPPSHLMSISLIKHCETLAGNLGFEG